MEIGNWVIVTATSQMTYISDGRRIIQRNPCNPPLLAMVTGGCKRHTGVYTEGSGYRGGWDLEPGEPDPPYLRDDKEHFFWLVRPGLLNKELLVLPDDLAVTPVFLGQKLPRLHVTQFPYSEENRQALRDAVKDVRRDKRGRFLSDRPKLEIEEVEGWR